MGQKNSYLLKDDQLLDLVKQLWQNKMLILSISILFMLIGFFLKTSKETEFTSRISIKNPTSIMFLKYRELVSSEQFVADFYLNFLSKDNLDDFLEQEKFDDFKQFLKKKNMTAKTYFSDNRFYAEIKNDKISQNSFILIFPKELQGDIFFNNYVEYVKKKTINEYKNKLKISILLTIEKYEAALSIAQKINLEDPLILKINSFTGNIINEPISLFYKGSKILSLEILQHKELLIKLEQEQFSYNPISEKASYPKLIMNSSSLYGLSGLTFGFFLSLIIIFFRHILNK